MSTDDVVHVSRDELYQPSVDKTLTHLKALARQSEPAIEQPVSTLRRVLLSNLFYTPLAGLLGGLTAWLILEPSLDDTAEGLQGPFWLLFPLTATLVVVFIFVGDGLSSRRLRGNVGRWLWNTFFTLLFSFVVIIPANIIFLLIIALSPNPPHEGQVVNIKELVPSFLIGFIIARSLAWALIGAALGLGINLRRCTSAQRRASFMGGVAGGTLGGLLFDPINRFIFPLVEDGSIMRFVGLCVIGLSVGVFVALSERLGRAGWVRVRTGPLRGKAFILYHNPTIIGSSPQATIYLFKDPKIAPEHIALHRMGSGYELVRTGDDSPVTVNNVEVHRQRLTSGDQIIVGDTILDYEERAKKRPVLDAVVKGAEA